MEEHCSTDQSPQWAVVLMEEEEEENFLYWQLARRIRDLTFTHCFYILYSVHYVEVILM